jgi:hypothetical protein
VVPFFCSRRGVAEQVDVKRILPTIAASLASRDAAYRHALPAVLDSSPIFTSSNLEVQIEVLLKQPLSGRNSEPPSSVMVIDALDECTDESSTRDLLMRLISIAPDLPLKFFLVSRPEPHIRAQLNSFHSGLRRILRLHEIEHDIVEKDISLYLTNRLRDIRVEWPDPLPEDWPASLHVANVTRHAGKFFIYAFTAVEYVRDDPVDRLLSLSGQPDSRHTRCTRSRHTHRYLDQKPRNYIYLSLSGRVVEAGKPLTKYLDDIYTRVVNEAMDPLKRDSTEMISAEQC